MATDRKHVLVVGSVNVDLYQRLSGSCVKIAGKSMDMSSVKGMTLPAKNFFEQPKIAAQLQALGLTCESGKEEELLLSLEGPFEQKTGGKGANAAAAAGQTLACSFLCHFGEKSATENKQLLADLQQYGSVDTSSSKTVAGPTGTAYILLFEDNDNAILLLGGANQSWDAQDALNESGSLAQAISECVAVMLQREIPSYVNVEVAKLAKKAGKPVFMDVGGTDAPLDESLLPYLSVIAPNETELTFIAGVETTLAWKPDIDFLRKAVSALKNKCAAVGNPSVEILVTLGSQGSMHFAADWSLSSEELESGLLPHETQVGSFALSTDNAKPRDTTGAGDCFRGSYVAARYGEGRSLQESMRWASAAASISVEIEGAMPSMPPRTAIEARAKQELIDSGTALRKRKTPS